MSATGFLLVNHAVIRRAMQKVEAGQLALLDLIVENVAEKA